jgi:hypothetical protein
MDRSLNVNDELAAVREDLAELRELVDRLGAEPVAGNRCVVGRTATKTTYPTAAASWFWVIRQAVGGTEAEGQAATFTDVGAPEGFYAYNLGQRRPPVGTRVDCDETDGRFTFVY